MGLMAGVSAGTIDAEDAERRARRLGRAYAAWAADRGVASPDMVHAFGFVRQTLIDAAIGLAQSENLEPNAVRGLVAVLERLTQAVEMGLLEASLPVHARTSGSG